MLTKELVDFIIPALGGSGNHLHAIDLVKEPDQDTGSEVMNDGCGMDSGVQLGFYDLEFEFSHILWEIIVRADVGIGKPSGGFCSGIGTEEGSLEVFDEVIVESEGGIVQGCLGVDCCPAFGRSFGHEQESITNFLVI